MYIIGPCIKCLALLYFCRIPDVSVERYQVANQLYSCPTEGSTTVRLHNATFVPGLRWPSMANYSSLPTSQAPTSVEAVSLLTHYSSLMAFPTSRPNPFVSMKAHIHDGLSSTLTEGSTAVFLHQTSLPGHQWTSSASYSHLTTHESYAPFSASMLAHFWRKK